jgi:uncharacterized protein YukE
MSTRTSAILLAAVLELCACGRKDTARSVTLTAPAATLPQSAPQTLVSEWQGSSQVTFTDSLPACVPTFWQTGFIDSMSWQLLKSTQYSQNQFDLHVSQKASGEFCHLNASIAGNDITTTSWDEMGAGWEGEGFCHFQLRTSGWNCPATAPEVWIDGIKINGSFADALSNRIQGVMEIKYDHRSGGDSYSAATVRKSFDVLKTSP